MSRERLFVVLSVACATVLSVMKTPAAPPQNFQNETVIASGLSFPTAIEFLPDGRMLVSEFGGRVRMVQSGATSVDSTPVMQLANVINENVTSGGERGLVNIIADPNFAANGYFYLFYTAGSPQRDRVSRFTLQGNTASLASEVVIWQGAAISDSTDHHGGGMFFGLDGKLYIATGDNGDASSSQSLRSDHGKVLRLNPDGTIPTDNPFYDGSGQNIDSIWALGLRNPFRMTQDPVTGRIYFGDVGFNSIEEVNLVTRGANYGWPVCEGSCGNAGMSNPVYSWNRVGRDGASMGGFIYRASQYPSNYQGVFFYADYAQNWIRYLTMDAQGTVLGSFNFEPADGSLDSSAVGDPVMIKPGPDGAIYYIDLGLSWAGGGVGGTHVASIRRIRYTAVNQPPVVNVSATPGSGPVPLAVNFSSAGSFDPEGQPLTYSWTFGDGGTSTAANPTHVYQQTGFYTVRLALSDGANVTQSGALFVAAGNQPVGVITTPADGTMFRAGDLIQFAGTGTDIEDGTLGPGAFSWSVYFHHDSHVHPTLGPLLNVTSGSFVVPNMGHDFGGTTGYEIVLQVTDSDGLPQQSSVFVYPEKVNLSFNTVPSGLALEIDGITRTTPFVKDTLIGFIHQVNAPNQSTGVSNFTFTSWSNGGQQSQFVTVPTAANSYTAYFQAAVNPLPSGVVVNYAFGEGSGTTVADASGQGHTGSLVNGPVWTTGKYGGGVSLDGVNDFIQITNPSTLNFGTSDFTIAVWVRRETMGAENTIFSKTASGSWTTAGKEFFISGADNKVAFGAWGIGEVFSTGTIVNDGQWHHVAVTFDNNADQLDFYLDGVPSGGGVVSLPADNASHVIKLGGHPAGHTFRGALDEFRVYNRALSPSEILVDRDASAPPPADTTAPVISNGQPSGTLPAGTTQTQISVRTDENATARYSTVPGTAYAAMTGVFTVTGGTNHAAVVNGLVNGASYTLYVKAMDSVGNFTLNDYPISFSVASPPPPDTTPPTLSNGQPTGTLASGTTQTTLSVRTDENATARYSTVPGTAYASMTGTFSSTGGTNHSTLLGGLVDGANYALYVKAIDGSGNVTPTDYVVSFAVASPPPPDTTAPTVGISSPTSGTSVSGTIAVSANASDNVGVVGVQFLLDGVNLGAEDTSAPYSVSWNTATANPGSHNLTARARDAAGNQTTSGSVSVTVPVSTGPTGRVVALAFGEGSGTTAVDSTGQSHTGTLVNGPTWIAGKYTGAVSLDGVNDYVQVANPATLNFGTSDFTMTVWVRREATGSENTIFSKTANSSWTTGGKELFISGTDNKVGFGAWGIGEAFSTGTIVNDGQWHHVAVRFTDSNNRIDFYLDGVASGGGTVNSPADDSSHAIKLGGHPAGHTFRGGLDEFRVYNRALSAAEIVSDRDTTGTPPPADTTAPILSNGQPTGILAAGTTQTTLTVRTDENSTTRYSTVAGTPYASMTGTFSTTGGTNHSTVLAGLVNGTSYTIYVKATDGAGNASANDYVVSFSVASPPPDTTAPVMSNGQPTGTLPAGTTQTTLSLRTDENATARYSTVPGTPYASMTGTFSTTGDTNHSTLVGGLVNGASYTVYVKAIDGAGNVTASDYTINFAVATPVDTTAPTLSNGQPSGTLPVGTTQTTLSVRTDENATARYSTVAGTPYAAMTGIFSTTGGTNHSTLVGGLANGTSYIVYVKAMDAAGNVTSGDYLISFAVASPGDTTAPTLSNGQPSGTLPAGTTQASLLVSSDENATCRFSTTPGTPFASMTNTFATTGGTSHSTLVGSLVNGASYTIYVKAMDGAGNVTASDYVISFSVASSPADTTAPTLSNGQPAGTLPAGTTQTTLSVRTDENATARYSPIPGVAYASMTGTFSTTGGTNHSTLLTGLANGAIYTIYVKAMDGAGNVTAADYVVNFTVATPADTTAPSVSISSPANGASVTGTISVSATASDNVGVVGVQFLLDGASLGAEDTSAPYSVSWNTATASAGSHTLSARARDAAGNVSTSIVVTVTVPSSEPTGRVVALAFSEGTGTSAADTSGQGHAGTLVNGPTWTAGRYGNAVSLDGVNDHVLIANPSTLNFANDFTAAVWVRREATGSEHTIFSKAATSSWNAGGKEFFISASDSRLGFGAQSAGELFSTGTVLNDGQWHHVVVTFANASNQLTFYIDGVASGGGLLDLPADKSNHVVKLGGHPVGHPFRGAMDEFRVYSRVLSVAEIQTIMNRSIAP